MSKTRRQFTDEFRSEVVALCNAGDRSIGQVARDLGLTETMVRKWCKKRQPPQISVGPVAMGALSGAEREELARLRKENTRLKMEREILKKAAAFFAAENA